MDSHPRRTRTIWLLFGPIALLVVLLVLESIAGGGHPPLSAVLLYWATYPTLAGYLSRSLFGSDFPSTLLLFVGLLEYPLVTVGGASLIARLRRRGSAGGVLALVTLLLYASAHGVAHLLFNLQSVNLRLMAHANPGVSMAAVNRLRDSGDADVLPAIQRKMVDDFERDGKLEAGTIDALTALGGARGWQDLLESGRLGAASRAAYAWRYIAVNVREMTNPMFAEPRGGVPTRGFSDQDITRFFDALALALATRLRTAPDDDAALTLLTVMKERPDLCQKYVEVLPDPRRNAAPCR